MRIIGSFLFDKGYFNLLNRSGILSIDIRDQKLYQFFFNLYRIHPILRNKSELILTGSKQRIVNFIVNQMFLDDPYFFKQFERIVYRTSADMVFGLNQIFFQIIKLKRRFKMTDRSENSKSFRRLL